MGINVNDVLDQALRLPPDARAALADSLLNSLEQPPDHDVEKLWRIEVRKRIAGVESGALETTPWPDVRARLIRQLQSSE